MSSSGSFKHRKHRAGRSRQTKSGAEANRNRSIFDNCRRSPIKSTNCGLSHFHPNSPDLRQGQDVDGLLIGIAFGVLSGVVVGAVAGITVLACKHPKSYEELYGALLIILLGALAGSTFWDLSHGAGYSRFVVIAVIIYFSFLRALPVILARDKPVKEGDD